MVQLLRRRLPSGIVGAVFGSKVVVDDLVKRDNVQTVIAIAIGRGGLFAVVMQSELDRVLAVA
ncbi:MAG TPA: hypothetical protein VGR43_02425 [Dehalococcoidia bacterium]|nr:hypothetical protein [Dehalococcoidia bacterium]